MKPALSTWIKVTWIKTEYNSLRTHLHIKMTWHSTTFCRVDKRRTRGTSHSLFVKAHKESQAVYESSQCVHAVHGPRGLSNINQLLLFFSYPGLPTEPFTFWCKAGPEWPKISAFKSRQGLQRGPTGVTSSHSFSFSLVFSHNFCLPHLSFSVLA